MDSEDTDGLRGRERKGITTNGSAEGHKNEDESREYSMSSGSEARGRSADIL